MSDRRNSFLGQSPAIEHLRRMGERLADAPFPLLIEGESGVGKYELSQFIHSASRRRNEPFLDFHCATVQATLFESELFGHERGSFTDAKERHVGHVERAGRGTLLFDEVDCLEPVLQGKLLRFVDTRGFERIGGRDRLVAHSALHFATNRDLRELVADDAFRFDLFSRIHWIPLRIPPLRERSEDIVFLAGVFLEEARISLRRGTLRWSARAVQRLHEHPWLGNVRELKSIATVAAYLHQGDGLIDTAEIDDLLVARDSPRNVHRLSTFAEMRGNAERAIIEDALRQCDGNRARAARLLGMGRRTLHEKMTRYRIS